jgi:hypothetical protein
MATSQLRTYNQDEDPYALPAYSSTYQVPQFDPRKAPDGNPIYYGQQIGAQDPSMSYIPDLTGNDPNRTFRNSQNVSYNLGSGINADLYKQGQDQQRMYAGYGNAMNSAYGDLQQNPGYTPEEAGNITRDGQYNSLATTPDEFNSLNPTGDESAGMKGDPSSYFNFYNPQAFDDTTQNSAQMQNAQLERAQGGIDSANRGLESRYGQAIDPNRLRASGAYGNEQSAELNATTGSLGAAQSNATGRMDSALANPGLDTTAEYERQAGMSDGEVDQARQAAERNIGTQYGAAMDAVKRNAAASGNASPLAVGAATDRLMSHQAVASADAATDAGLAARQAQRNAASGVQQTKLGAAQYKTGAGMQAGQYLGGLQSQNAQYLGNAALNATQQKENTRLGAEQNLAGMDMSAANSLGQNQLQGAEYMGNSGLNAVQNWTGQQMDAQKYKQGLGTGIQQSAEQTAAGRATQGYGIRQGNTQYAQQAKYGQGMGIADRQSQNAQTVANARRAGQQENRQWLTGQTGQALGATQTNNQQRIGNYGVMAGAMNNNAGQWGNYQLEKAKQPGLFDKIVGGVAGAAKAAFAV